MVKKRYRYKPEKEDNVYLVDLGCWLGVLGTLLGILLIGMLCFAINEVIYARDLGYVEDTSWRGEMNRHQGYSHEDVQIIGLPFYVIPDNLSTPFICENVTCDRIRSEGGLYICINDSMEYVIGDNFTYLATDGYDWLLVYFIEGHYQQQGLTGGRLTEWITVVGLFPTDDSLKEFYAKQFPDAILFGGVS